MKSIVLEAPGRLTPKEVAEPGPPGPGQATVRVLRVGICGTDLHAYLGNQAFIRYPVVLGHELAVEVVAVGPDDYLGALRDPAHGDHAPRQPLPQVGDRCTVIPYLADGTCPACLAGRPNCCASLKVLGVHVDGGMRELLNLPLSHLMPANDLPLDQLALIEMLAVGAHGVRRAGLQASETVLVLGAGPIGLSAVAFARLHADRVLGFDLNPARTAFLQESGLAEAVAPEGEALGANWLEGALRARLGGRLPDVVIDATGSRISMEQAAGYAEHGGRVVFLGHTAGQLTFDNQTLHRKELSVTFSRNADRADFEQVLERVRSREVDTTSWVSTRTAMAELSQALPLWTSPGQAAIGQAVIKAVASWPAVAATYGTEHGSSPRQERA